MKDILIYDGELTITPNLSEQELNFLNTWQNLLSEKFLKISNTEDNILKVQYYNDINQFIGLPLDSKQLWVLEFSFNPLIKFEKDKIIIKGEHSKGQLRDSLLMYHHLFLSEEPFLKKYLPNIEFLTEHSFSGIIQCEKNSQKTGHTQWCYIAEKSIIYAVNAKTKNEYINNKHKYPKQDKDDKSEERINRYYPKDSPLMRFVALNVKLKPKKIHTKKVKI